MTMTEMTEKQKESALQLGAAVNFYVSACKENRQDDETIRKLLEALQEALKNSLGPDTIQGILEGSGNGNTKK